jgi:3-oxoacyl-[acyl-carrier-protein] synthase-3
LVDELQITRDQFSILTKLHGLELIASGSSVTATQLINKAVERLSESCHLWRPEQVAYVLHCHTTPSVGPSHQDPLLEMTQRFGLDRSSAVHLTQQNCATAVSAVEMSRALLTGAQADKSVLIVTGEKAFHPDVKYMKNIAILGEASCAVLVSRCPEGMEVLSTAQLTRGEYSNATTDPGVGAEYTRRRKEFLADVATRALTRGGVSKEEITLYSGHNVNKMLWQNFAQEMGIPVPKMYMDNVPRLGHCFTSDPFLNLDSAILEGRVTRGELMMLVCIGIGAFFASMIVRV